MENEGFAVMFHKHPSTKWTMLLLMKMFRDQGSSLLKHNTVPDKLVYRWNSGLVHMVMYNSKGSRIKKQNNLMLVQGVSMSDIWRLDQKLHYKYFKRVTRKWLEHRTEIVEKVGKGEHNTQDIQIVTA